MRSLGTSLALGRARFYLIGGGEWRYLWTHVKSLPHTPPAPGIRFSVSRQGLAHVHCSGPTRMASRTEVLQVQEDTHGKDPNETGTDFYWVYPMD